MLKDYFTKEALAAAKALVDLKYSENEEDQLRFSEAAYDFARCQRPDGSFYGTGGQCRKGTEAGAAPAREGTRSRAGRLAAEKARAEGKVGEEIRQARRGAGKAAIAASRAEGGRKATAKNNRVRAKEAEFRRTVKELQAEMKNAKTQDQRDKIVEKYQKSYEDAANRAEQGG